MDVEKLLNVKGKADKRQYLVHWKGWLEEFATWEPIDNVGQQAIDDFWKDRADYVVDAKVRKLIGSQTETKYQMLVSVAWLLPNRDLAAVPLAAVNKRHLSH